jgi:large subunit ribosomal protein L21
VYAVVRTGGKQYRVEEGRAIKIDRLAGEPGETVELGEVLLMADGDDVTVGTPTVAGARILGTIAEQGRARKIVVFRYKSKTRSRKKTGHRQHFTRVVIDDILAAGQQPKPKQAKAAPAAEAEADAPPKRGRRKSEPKPAATAPDPEAEATIEEAALRRRLGLEAAATGSDQPAAEQPAAEQPAAEQPATEEAPAEQPPADEKPKRSRRKAD